ncbi:MAG: hypothetical protein K6G56_04720 [Clostridiales bacterium]|nr:hypothetical protein [Clostridiales bacterium]
MKNAFLIIITIIAAAATCLTLLSGCASPAPIPETETGTETVQETASASAVQAFTETPQKEILYEEGGFIMGDWEPGKGEVNMASPLDAEAAKPENADCLFAVRIVPHGFKDDEQTLIDVARESYLKTKEQLNAAPIMSDFHRKLLAWIYQNNKPRENPDEYYEDEFLEYWEIEDSEACLAYKEIKERINENEKTWSDTYRAAVERKLEGEIKRLAEAGIYVTAEYKKAAPPALVGCLTPEQVLSFPASNEYGYYIYWIEKDEQTDQ